MDKYIETGPIRKTPPQVEEIFLQQEQSNQNLNFININNNNNNNNNDNEKYQVYNVNPNEIENDEITDENIQSQRKYKYKDSNPSEFITIEDDSDFVEIDADSKVIKYTDEQLFQFLKGDQLFNESLSEIHEKIQGEVQEKLGDPEFIRDLSLFEHLHQPLQASLSKENLKEEFLKPTSEIKSQGSIGGNISNIETHSNNSQTHMIQQNNLVIHSPLFKRKNQKPQKKTPQIDNFHLWKNFFCTECDIKFQDASFYAEKPFWKDYSSEITLSNVSKCFTITENDLKNKVEIKSVGHRKRILYVFSKRMKDLEQRKEQEQLEKEENIALSHISILTQLTYDYRSHASYLLALVKFANSISGKKPNDQNLGISSKTREIQNFLEKTHSSQISGKKFLKTAYYSQVQILFNELIKSEKSYAASLVVFIKHFLTPVKEKSTKMRITLSKVLTNHFSAISTLSNASHEFLHQLGLIESTPFPQRKLSQSFVTIIKYLHTYMSVSNRSEKVLEAFEDVIQQIYPDDENRTNEIANYLTKPYERLFEYSRILSLILSKYPKEHIDYKDLSAICGKFKLALRTVFLSQIAEREFICQGAIGIIMIDQKSETIENKKFLHLKRDDYVFILDFPRRLNSDTNMRECVKVYNQEQIGFCTLEFIRLFPPPKPNPQIRFSVEKYNPLIELLSTKQRVLAALVSVGSTLENLDFLKSLLGMLPPSSIVEIFARFLQKDLRTITDPNTMFRQDSPATLLFVVWSRVVGKEFLKNTLAPLIKPITLNPNELDIKKPHDVQTISKLTKQLINSLTQISQWPSEIRYLCIIISQNVKNYFPQSVRNGLASFIFLRLIVPILINPDLYIQIEKVSTSARKNLVTISRIIQNLANGVSFRENDGMFPLNAALDQENITKIDQFFNHLASDNQAFTFIESSKMNTQSVTFEQCYTFHNLLMSNLQDILEKIIHMTEYIESIEPVLETLNDLFPLEKENTVFLSSLLH